MSEAVAFEVWHVPGEGCGMAESMDTSFTVRADAGEERQLTLARRYLETVVAEDDGIDGCVYQVRRAVTRYTVTDEKRSGE